MAKSDKTKQDKYKTKSKNIYEKNKKEYIFCTNLDINNFKYLVSNKENLNYFFKKFIIRENEPKEKRYLGEIEFNNEEIKRIKEIEILKPKYHQSIVKEYINSIKEYCNELNFILSDEIEAITSYRLVVGLGNPSVTETSMTLHNIYGIPYIPGQALKGIVRSYFLQKYYDIEKRKFDKIVVASKDFNSKELYKNIFGDDFDGEDNQKGNVIFFDSFPVSKEITIEKDVMTPHYRDYYEKGQNPTDEFNTNPITFYTIRNTKFNFMFALSNKKNDINKDEFIDFQNLKKFIVELIEEALEEHGIGAKTSVGYGYFDIDKEQVENKLKQEEEKRLKQEEIFKKKIEQENKFKEDTKGMSEFEVKLYELDQIKDKDNQHRRITDFFNNIDNFEKENQEKLARYMKNYLEDDWKIKRNKKGQIKDKNSKRVKKICEILKIDLPE